MINYCYKQAGVNLTMAKACDLIQNDSILLLWEGLNYAKLVETHRRKYQQEYSFIKKDVIDKIISTLSQMYEE